MFPMCVRYLSFSHRMQFNLLDLYEDSDESANVDQAPTNEKHELYMRHITAYAANNVNLNFGKQHSVYQLMSSNSHILKDNCPALQARLRSDVSGF